MLICKVGMLFTCIQQTVTLFPVASNSNVHIITYILADWVDS